MSPAVEFVRDRLWGKERNLTRVWGGTNKAQFKESIKNVKILPLDLAKEHITDKGVKPVGGGEKEGWRNWNRQRCGQ